MPGWRAGARLGDPELSAMILGRHADEIHRCAARRLGRPDAADVVSGVFLAAFRNHRRQARPASLTPVACPPAAAAASAAGRWHASRPGRAGAARVAARISLTIGNGAAAALPAQWPAPSGWRARPPRPRSPQPWGGP